MQLTCPCCHAHVPLAAALQDEAGRELVAMLAAMQPGLALPLVHYLGFFRPARQQLGWGRSLRLAQEVVALHPNPVDVLIAGLVEAARALDEKRHQGGWKPLGNHNYLRRVLDGLQARADALPALSAERDFHAPVKLAPRSQADAGRLHQAFLRVGGSADRWPTPRQVLDAMPPRPRPLALPQPRTPVPGHVKELLTRLRGAPPVRTTP